MFTGIQELTGDQKLHPGGHNFPDMQVVVDPTQTEIEDNGIYLVQVKDRDPVVKRLVNKGDSEVYLHPALSTVHGQRTVTLFGREMPCQTIEFSDNIYRRYITVHGRVVGIWAGAVA